MRARVTKLILIKAGKIESREEVKLQDEQSWWSNLGFLACVLSTKQGLAALCLHDQLSLDPSSWLGLVWQVPGRLQQGKAP